MNIHRTWTYSLTTGSATEDGAAVDLAELERPAVLLASQCSVQGTLPAGVSLVVGASATHATALVTGGALPGGTVLSGTLSVVSATP